jgi:Gas vesicle synthesis protein GvpL/GvpF/Gas vesicle protein K
VARTAAVVPARLASVYRDDTRVAGMLGERGPDFRDTLRRLAGRTEWGIKVYGAANPPIASTGAPPAGTDATRMALEERMVELRDHFGLAPEELNLDLGPLGPLLPREYGDR